jgi:hypothetical protein
VQINGTIVGHGNTNIVLDLLVELCYTYLIVWSTSVAENGVFAARFAKLSLFMHLRVVSKFSGDLKGVPHELAMRREYEDNDDVPFELCR